MEAIQKKFNQILNQSDDNRFNVWKEYRDSLTNHLLEVIDKLNNRPDIIIIGAGNSDDIDLRKLEEKSNKLVLTDIDDLALKSAKEKYQLNNVDLISIDYLGFEDNALWNNFLTNIIKLEVSKYEDYINMMFDSAKPLQFRKYQNKFDYVIVSPIYTQLLLPSFLQQLSFLEDINLSEFSLKSLKELFLKKLSNVIIEFNSNILKLGKNNSHYTIISDIFEVDIDSDFYKDAETAFNNDKMDILLEDYRDKYGYGLGDYGLEHFKDYIKPTNSIWLKWPFSDKRILYNKIVDFIK
jgi:hypothetical protein